MCKFFILWNNFSKYKKLSNEIDNKYKKFCDDNILSNGICIVKNKNNKIKRMLCFSICKNKIDNINLSNSPDYLFY